MSDTNQTSTTTQQKNESVCVKKEAWIKKNFDWVAIIIAILAIFSNFVIPHVGGYKILNIIICVVAGVVGICYLARVMWLYWARQVDFDWELINGHFLRKVICIVLLMPSVLALFPSVFDASPKAFAYEENLYECSDNDLPCSIKRNQESPNIFWSVYLHFMDPGNQPMTTTKGGRIYAAIIAILGVFLLNGLLVSSIIGWIDRRKEMWRDGSIRYDLRHLGDNKFAVVIGANEIAASVIKNLFTPKKAGDINFKCEGENQYVILQTNRDVEKVREVLNSHLEEEHMRRLIIYKALRDSQAEIENLNVETCTEIYVLGESTLVDGGEPFHDAMNMRCVNLIAQQLEQTREKREQEKDEAIKNGSAYRSVRRVCKVMFEYQTTSSVFYFSDVTDRVRNNLVFIPFSRYESWARKVMVDGHYRYGNTTIDYTPLDGNGIHYDSDNRVHLVIVGMSKMGIAMGVQALLQAHYVNYAYAEKKQDVEKMNLLRTRITFIDTNADKEMAFFKGRYANLFELIKTRYIDASVGEDYAKEWDTPLETTKHNWQHLSENGKNFLDVEIEFINGELESDGVRECLEKISQREQTKLTFAVCLTRTNQAVAASLYMPLCVYEKAQEIWVYQREAEDIITNLTSTKERDKRYKKLKAFGMLYGEYMNDRAQYLQSILVNGVYELEGIKDGIKMSEKSTYTILRETWKDLSVDKRFSNRYYVDSIGQKIRSISPSAYSSAGGLKLLLDFETTPSAGSPKETIIDTLARCEHNRWNVQQLLLGYLPCDKEEDALFETLQSDCRTAAAETALKDWKKSVGWGTLSPREKIRKKKEDEKYSKLPHGIFDAKKREYKEGEKRKHPNLCAFAHLDKVDAGAMGYDKTLNKYIPYILELVDDRIK